MAKSKQAQALAIKLSRERREGKSVPAPPKGRYSEQTRKRALRDIEVGRQRARRRASSKTQTKGR
jgi:hypothetical protein